MTSDGVSTPVHIAMWSGPRNISTAMMRSFGSRQDTHVTDEPFYGAFLRDTGEPQPMADQIIADMDCDWQSVTGTLRGPVPGGKAIWYQKHMPHQMTGPISILDFPDHRHAFLIRDPAQVVASYAAKRVKVTPDDLGYERQLRYVEEIGEKTGKTPFVIDSSTILANPDRALKQLCIALEIDWDPSMLSWAAGRRETDGIWGSHWYNRVVETTGFGPLPESPPPLEDSDRLVAEKCQIFYSELLGYAYN
ncbi:MAG: HAD family hydrolase [Pseudomonadota bacterium]